MTATRRAVRITGLLAAVAFVALLVYGLTSQAPNSTIDDSLSKGRAVTPPGFALKPLTGGDESNPAWARAAQDGEVDLKELRGTPVVLNFWASWCDPCRAEAKVLERVNAGGTGALFLGIDTEDASEDARDFISQFGLTFPHVRDNGRETRQDWGVTGLPETFFLSAEGKVVGHVIGTVDEQQLQDGIAAAKSGRPQSASQGGEQGAKD